jgi:hypothetical protein
VVVDAACHDKALRTHFLDEPATRNAVVYHRAPPHTGRRGRPRREGGRIPVPPATAVFQTVAVARYGRTDTVRVAVLDCLRYGVYGHPRPRPDTKPMLALIAVTGADLVTRPRRPAVHRGRRTLDVGRVRNRTAQAITRTWAFGM